MIIKIVVVVAVQSPVVSDSLQPHGLQHTRSSCPSPFPRVCPSSCSLHQWCHLAISFSDTLFSFCHQSFPASGTYPMSHLCTSDDQNTGVSASASGQSMINWSTLEGWSPSRLTGLSSLLSKGLSKVFSSSTVRRHQFFGALPSLRSSLHNHHDHWEDHSLDYMKLCQQSNVSAFQHTIEIY